MAQAEFELIREYFQRQGLAFPVPGLVSGIGDDCALLEPGPGQQLTVSMDMLQEGVHFPLHCEPGLLAQRALLVNLSDLAAAGAQPLCFTLALSLPAPRTDRDWLERFSQGLAEVASANGCALAGGDMSRGPLGLCIQVHGLVEQGGMLRRDGARPGDSIYVSGTLGDAAAALPLVLGQGEEMPDAVHRDALLQAYYRPESRIKAGMALRGLASSAIDLSDGLASDLGHILRASGVGARVELPSLPLSLAFRAAVPPSRQTALAVSGGDDYELCFTVPRARCADVEQALAALDVPLARIGEIVPGGGLEWLDGQGQAVALRVSAYQHFA